MSKVTEITKNIDIKRTIINHTIVNKTTVEECSNFINMPSTDVIKQFNMIEHNKVLELKAPKCLENGEIRIGTVKNKENKQEVYYSMDEQMKRMSRVLMGSQGAGKDYYMGNYIGCTFGAEGIGTFMPLEGSNPYVGKMDQLETVKEVRLECMVEPSQVQELMDIIKRVHPYEEVAYDLYNLENIEHCEGIGRVGVCDPIKVSDFISKLKQFFGIPYVRLVAKEDKMISKVALCSGSGGSFIGIAATQADLYITGDVSFHQAQEALSKGLVVVDVGHYASENIAMPIIESYLTKQFKNMKIVCSNVDGETFQTL